MVNSSNPNEVQQHFLAELVRKKTPVAVYLKNGIKLKGVICAFDEYSILLDQPSLQVVYKTAISTIAPLLTFFPEMGQATT